MLKKLKTMKYEHFENEASAEIIDKAYRRAENSARHLWPMYVFRVEAPLLQALVPAYIFSIRWWLLLTVLIPFSWKPISRRKQTITFIQNWRPIGKRTQIQYL